MMQPDLTDDEIDRICGGLRQSAAKVRYLQGLGLTVRRKPNGRPLVARAHFDEVMARTGQDQRPAPVNGPRWSVAA